MYRLFSENRYVIILESDKCSWRYYVKIFVEILLQKRR